MVIGCAADPGKLAEGGGILRRQLPVHRDLGHIRRGGIHRNVHIHLAPGNCPLYALLDSVLRKAVHPGHLHGTVQITVIDGADLHGDIPLVPHFSRPTIAGHAFDHADSSYFTGKRLPQTVILPCQSTFPPVLHVIYQQQQQIGTLPLQSDHRQHIGRHRLLPHRSVPKVVPPGV